MSFEKGEHYKRAVRIMDSRGCISIELTHWETDADSVSPDTLVSVITMDIGACHVHANITPTEARAMAIVLQAHADEVEEHQREMDEVTA